MYQDSEYVELGYGSGNIPVFGGGLVDNNFPTLIRDGDSPLIQNARIKSNTTVPSPGFYQIGDDMPDEVSPKGIGSYLRIDDDNSRIVIYQNNLLRSFNPEDSTFTTCTGQVFTGGDRMNFVRAGDNLYCFNGVDEATQLNGTNLSRPFLPPADFSDTFSPKFGKYFDGSLWVGLGTEEVYKSVGAEFTDFQNTGSDIFTFDETITGLASISNALLYFTRNNIHTTYNSDIIQSAGVTTYTNTPLRVSEGSINNETIVTAGNKVFFVTPSNKIKAVGQDKDGIFQTTELSHRENYGIDTLMSTLDDNQDTSFGYFLPKEKIIKWFFKSQGSNINDICIIYDIANDVFLQDTERVYFDAVHHKGKNYAISAVEPKLYLDEVGNTNDDGIISFKKLSKEYTFPNETRKFEIYEARTILALNFSAEITQNIYLDGGLIDSYTFSGKEFAIGRGIGARKIAIDSIGTGNTIDSLYNTTKVREKSKFGVRGYKLQVEWICNSFGANFKLIGFDIRVQQLNPLTSKT